MSCFVDWPAREKILRGHTRFDVEFEPADLVCRIRWKTERTEFRFSRISTVWGAVEVCRAFTAPMDQFRCAWTISLFVVERQALLAWTAEVEIARRTPGGRYLSFGSRVKTAESRELDETLRLSPENNFPWTGTFNTLTTWPGRRGHRLVEGSTGS